MAVKVILFGQLVDITGEDTLQMEGVSDTETLQRILHAKYPSLSGRSYRIAVEKKLVTENTSLNDNSSVALLPPFSGG